MQPVVDLRSDTVTKPTTAMRAAMAAAVVGDDVYGDDPTVHELEARIAAMLGHEAGIFMPSGTMANQVALRLLAAPGESILIGENAHVWLYESGGLAALAGVQTTPLGRGGTFHGADIRAAYQPSTFYLSPTSVVTVENTHNAAGGVVWPREQLTEVIATAQSLGLKTHLDGARIWHAAIVQGVSERALCTGFDTVSVSLSKGLGAPVGSVLASSRARIEQARRLRKMYGGGMRQVGILAAAGLHALAHHRERLGDDHRRARALAQGLSDDSGRLAVTTPETNIVLVTSAVDPLDTAKIVAAARAGGVLVGAPHGRTLRLVTHLDVTDGDVERAISVLRPLLYAA